MAFDCWRCSGALRTLWTVSIPCFKWDDIWVGSCPLETQSMVFLLHLLGESKRSVQEN